MSVTFDILCARSPAAFLRKKTRWLKWSEAKRSGSFGGMSLSLESPDEDLELPSPDWKGRIVAVIHAEGHFNDDANYDAFDDWSTALAKATRGAVHGHRFT